MFLELAFLVIDSVPIKVAPPDISITAHQLLAQANLGELQKLLDAAICDAKTPEESEISSNLWALSPENRNLVRGENGNRQENGKDVLVVTWQTQDYAQKITQGSTNLPFDVWVTPVPQVKNFCSALGLEGDLLSLRLNQYLGLRLEPTRTKFVSIWINPQSPDIFRPCPDAEVDDKTCQIDFPNRVNPNHKTWIDAERTNYKSKEPYPWTQLGYTYDWGNTIKPHIGASEFVIRKGGIAKIESVDDTKTYCSK